jgi:ATP-dependent DNA ligase
VGANWVNEMKFDGYRLLGFVSEQAIRLIACNGKDWTGSFPSLSAALSGLVADNAVLDMAVVLDAGGKVVSNRCKVHWVRAAIARASSHMSSIFFIAMEKI